jgi:hypothetical protein
LTVSETFNNKIKPDLDNSEDPFLKGISGHLYDLCDLWDHDLKMDELRDKSYVNHINKSMQELSFRMQTGVKAI